MLVTGATGFIGTRLCERLAGAGCEVHGLSRCEGVRTETSMKWHTGDLADSEVVDALVSSLAPDTVFHLASEVTGKSGHELVSPMLQSNLLGTVNLLAAVQDAGCRRMVATGTVVEPREDEPASSPYAAAKSAATAQARMFHSLYGTPVVCLRLGMVYGPGQPDPNKLIPHTIESLLRGESPQISSGRWEVDWVYVDDVVEALVRAAVADDVEGETLDVGSGQVASVRDVVEHLADAIDSALRPSFGAVEDRAPEPSIPLELDRTRKSLGWSPATGLPDGLKQTVSWYRKRLSLALMGLAPTADALWACPL